MKSRSRSLRWKGALTSYPRATSPAPLKTKSGLPEEIGHNSAAPPSSQRELTTVKPMCALGGRRWGDFKPHAETDFFRTYACGEIGAG